MTTHSTVLAGSAGLKAALGHYGLVAEIGRGGMANVFLALQLNADGTSRRVVLKQLQSELASEQDFRAMFESEARLAKRFRHRNVVETYDIYADRKLCVLVMEFLNGQTLARIRERAKGDVPFAIHLRVLAEMLAGLHYVHELTDEAGAPLGIVHRDVTPSNVFVTYDGRVKVIDFGIAKATMVDANANIRFAETRIGVLKGKLAYMSPEAVRNEPFDRRSDIFSAGVMLWEAATGRRLWHGHDEMAVFQRLAAGDLPLQAPVEQSTSAAMLRIAARALAVDPSRRYATAEEMRLELEELIARLGKPAQPSALAGYMEAFFSVERANLQKVVDEALAGFPSRAVPGSLLIGNELGVSHPGADPTEFVATLPSSPAGEDSLRTTTTAFDVAGDGSWLLYFRRHARSGLGAAFVALAAVSVAYVARVPSGAPVSAAPVPVALKTEASFADAPARDAPVRANGVGPPLVLAPQAPPPSTASTATQLAPGEILAVFVARPAHARLFLDGIPLTGNPANIRRQSDDKRHLLRAEAPGYATLVRTVELSHDVANELELAPEATQVVVAPPSGSATENRNDLSKTRSAKPAAVRDDPWGI